MVAYAVALSAGRHAGCNGRARGDRIDAQQIGQGGLLDVASPLPDVLVDNREHPRKNGGGGVALNQGSEIGWNPIVFVIRGKMVDERLVGLGPCLVGKNPEVLPV